MLTAYNSQAESIFWYNKNTNIREEIIMVFRCMMIVFLLMISMIPAWASEKNAWLNNMPSYIADEYQAQQEALAKHEQAKKESPLSKLRIESEGWHEDSTQYFRYTFTNPTDMLIQEKIAYIRILYEAFTTAKPFDLQIHSTDAIRELIVEPNSSASITVSIPQKAPIIFVNQLDTTFFLNEYDSIYYLPTTPTVSDPVSFVPTPTRLPSGEFVLSLENRTSLEVDSELRDVSISAMLLSEKHPDTKFFGTCIMLKPLPFSVKPNETVLIPIPLKFYKFQNEDEPTLFDSVNIDPDFAVEKFSLTAKIDDTLYRRDHKVFFNPLIYEFKPPATTTYDPTFRWTRPKAVALNGSYQINGKTLTAYVHLKNTKDHILNLEEPTFKLSLTYLTTDSTENSISYKLALPTTLQLKNNEDIFYSFSVQLPDDAATIPLAPDVILIAFYKGTEQFFAEYLTEKSPTKLQLTNYTYLGETIKQK